MMSFDHQTPVAGLVTVALVTTLPVAVLTRSPQPSELLATGTVATAIDYQPSSDSLIVILPSAHAAGSALERVTQDGIRFQFARTVSPHATGPVVVVQDDGEFAHGDVFTSRGAPGEITRLSERGAPFGDPWAALPGEPGAVSALAFDRGGSFGRRLLAGTTAGNIWQVDDAGKASLLAVTGEPIRALLPLPSLSRFGAASGRLLAATGSHACQLLAIETSGRPEPTGIDVGCVTDLDLVVPDADLFAGVSLREGAKAVHGILRVDAVDLAPNACSVLLTGEDGAFHILGWTANGPFAVAARWRAGAAARVATFAGSPIRCEPEVCGDGTDNNGDGEVDEGCVERCGDGVDNNSDGEVDEGCAEVCGDGEDNDGNGVIDDGCREVCGDGIDNDGDDLVDAPCDEICGDGLDNDRNNHVDDGCPAPPRNAGCPASYWSERTDDWPLDATRAVATLFSVPVVSELAELSRERLVDLLGKPTTASAEVTREARRVLAAGTAAMLSALDPGVGYPSPPPTIYDRVSEALESNSLQRMRALASVLEAQNSGNCTVRSIR